MPANVVKTAEQERLWRKAKERAEAEGQAGNHAYVVGVFKRMGGLEKSLRKSAGPFIGPRGGKWADAKHTIPWKPVRTGAVPIDNAELHKLTDALTSGWQVDKRGQWRDGGDNRLAVKRTVLATPDGQKHPVRVQLIADNGRDYPGGRSARGDHQIRASGDGLESHLTVYYRAQPGSDADTLRREIRRVLGHEMVHAADPTIRKRAEAVRAGRKKAPKEARITEDYAAYVNSKHEVTARIHEITRHVQAHANEFKEAYDDAQSDSDMPPASRATDAVEWSPTWQHYEQHFTPENRKRILRAVQDTLDAIHAGELQQIEKSQTKRWTHDDAAAYVENLRRAYGRPSIEQGDLVSWDNVPGFDYVYVVDESVPHDFPAPHRDFVYGVRTVSGVTPEHVAAFAKVTESIMFDRLKSQVTARCGGLDANAVSLGMVEEVVAGKARPTRAEYARRIKGKVLPSWYRSPEKLEKASAGEAQPIHVTQVQPSWMRMPGASTMLRGHRLRGKYGQRGESPGDRYLKDLYTAKRMPRPQILISDGGPFFNGHDVVKGLPLTPGEESVWATRIDDWVARAQDTLALRRALFASLRDYPEVDPLLRAELARRALMLFDTKREQAGDFIVKAHDDGDRFPMLYIGDFEKAYGAGRQSTRGQQVGVRDRKPPGVGRHPGRTVSPANGKPGPNGNGNGPTMNGGDPRPKPPPTPTQGRDTGIKDEDNSLDTADLDSPDEEGHVKSKLEALVKELHALHEHMDEDDDHLVEMHNAIKDKMRDAYNSGDPAGLKQVQHLIHHFHEIVMGAPDDEEPDPATAGMPKGAEAPKGAPPPMAMKKSGIYVDVR